MARTTDFLAILFADIAKSTHIYEALGDQAAKNLIDACISVLSEIAEKHRGTVVKTIGDEIMCTFPSANDAVEAAVRMHQSLDDLPLPDNHATGSPNIYVGFQFGKVIRQGSDVFGDAVNIASRMASLAKQRQIITTEDTVKLLSRERRMTARCIDQTTVKGKSGGIRIYEVIWEEHDLTIMATASQEITTGKCRLELKYQDLSITLDENRPSAAIGRQRHNDVVVRDSRVSRSHARIEYNRGKFTLIDQSSNGTLIKSRGKKSLLLKREEIQLLGSGVIGLGRDISVEPETAIHYTIKS
jgi:class 3 adenylate cyclase